MAKEGSTRGRHRVTTHSKGPTSVLGRVKGLNPRVFEHLVYDLLVRKGFLNVSWRTPGADGGRDLEADVKVVDVSGFTRLERWHVECKRYSAALNWPSVREKIAFAENHDADYLLICTTSSLSSTCLDEIATRARRIRRPIVRSWEGAALEHLLLHDPALMAKYGLSDAPSREAIVLPLLWHVTKAVQADYGSRGATGASSATALELAAALSELAVVSAEGNGRRTHHPTLLDRDLYAWANTRTASLEAFDSYAVRALLTATHFMTGSERVQIETRPKQHTLEIGTVADEPSAAFRALLDAIALAADAEWQFSGKRLLVKPRR